MKNLKLGTKIIGMVVVLLVLMVVSNGFGIIKIGNIGNEIKGITEEDIPLTANVTEIAANQLEQAVWFERALRFGEVLASKETAREGLKHAKEQFEILTKAVDEEIKKGEEIAENAAKVARIAGSRSEFEKIDERFKVIDERHANYEQYVQQIFALIGKGELHKAEGLAEKVEKEEKYLDHELQQLSKDIEKFTAEAALTAEHDEHSAKMGMSVISIFSIVFGLIMGIFITRGITKPLNRVIEGLNEGAEQISSASGQVSSASQSLAEGSSEQAASIEETSSSLEEISSMTKQNADNTMQAKNSRDAAYQSLMTANEAMTDTMEAMGSIKSRGEEIGKIIKTIDEIAFQTNLLALNAAVEAARAGEAGAGFAVVADEVRNLAMRAAEAAKNTQNMIEKTVGEINTGSQLVERTRQAFDVTIVNNKKVAELIDEIAAASTEQSQGIEQVNTAVAEMDKVVQQNAANAEENASASEEMNAQAEEMKSFVNDLMALVGGSTDGAGNGRSLAFAEKHKTRTHGSHPAPANMAKGKEVAVYRGGEVSPDKLIPLDDGDFRDF